MQNGCLMAKTTRDLLHAQNNREQNSKQTVIDHFWEDKSVKPAVKAFDQFGFPILLTSFKTLGLDVASIFPVMLSLALTKKKKYSPNTMYKAWRLRRRGLLLWSSAWQWQWDNRTKKLSMPSSSDKIEQRAAPCGAAGKRRWECRMPCPTIWRKVW